MPIALTGTTVGLISTIGFTPDLFAYPLVGWFIDNFGAASSYHYYFNLLVCAAIVGVFLALVLTWLNQTNRAG